MNLSVDILAASILIVDDQSANVQLLEQLLGGAGYTNVSATMKPEEVCALHRKNAYDLNGTNLSKDGLHFECA